MKTLEDARQWERDHFAQLDESRLACDDGTVVTLNRLLPDKSRELWNSGCWMQAMMQEVGATEKDIHDAQFACGQRGFAGDSWPFAVQYINHFIETRQLKEKPGLQLADAINKEMFGAT